VPICEENPYESVKTNIIGHQNVIECVNLYGDLESLIFVSTDKACKPINVYGMCKAISEQLYISYAKQQENTKVVLVRYGNVLESTGSVIPYFKNLLNNNTAHLPITHFDMTRFLLTLEQATDLIEWAYEYDDSHGKIAVPKVKSLKVVDIANVLIDSYGLDVKLREIGIRPGEKLHEEMVSSEEWMRSEELEDFFLIGHEHVNSNHHSYNSLDYLMDSSEACNFLQKSGVIQ
jgi:FlaA1/EpsC-like NDP-sugar epimerase